MYERFALVLSIILVRYEINSHHIILSELVPFTVILMAMDKSINHKYFHK